MTKRTLYTYAVIWTLMMCGYAFINDGAPAGIIVPTASMWFWLGRFSMKSEILMDDEIAPAPQQPSQDQKWGRS